VERLARLWAVLRSLPQAGRTFRYWGRRERAAERRDRDERARQRALRAVLNDPAFLEDAREGIERWRRGER
jgi:hypothetical protein